MTRVLGENDLDEAVAILAAGGLVAVPTETVYGLAGDASNPEAVDAIFRAKGRPAGHPLIVHLPDLSRAQDWVRTRDPRVALLAKEFWPGPLTMIVARSDKAVPAVTGGRPTVGIRVPNHALTLRLLERFGGGLAAPSANRFGHVSPTSAAHVLADLDNKIDAVLDGGSSTVGIESTIVEVLDGEPVRLLRPGGVWVEQIERCLGEVVLDGRDGPSRAAGMLSSHYAPSVPARLVDEAEARLGLESGSDVVVIGPLGDRRKPSPRWFELPVVAGPYAAGLYEALRAAEDVGPAEILITPPRLGGTMIDAVLDRLAKATHPT